jgi:hypothetical protein
MELGEVVAARRLWEPRPYWSSIVTKAYALVAAHMPILRRSYLGFPWPHLYEHRSSVAAVTMERDFQGEEIVVFAHARQPHTWPLAGLDAYLRRCKDGPLDRLPNFRSARRLGRLPRPLRRLALWLGLHGSGPLRERSFGTFGLSTSASQGAGMLHLLVPWTTGLHYGQFDADGRVDMRLTFDHRVLDGATAARALHALEAALCGPLLAELRRPAAAAAA